MMPSDAQVRVYRAMSGLPGGVGLIGLDPHALTLDNVAEWLERTSQRLKLDTLAVEKDRIELAHLKWDIAALRRILGVLVD